ncbi:glutathione S-transferase family protein [Ferrovibrio sp.]|uniref:glutathione S-transferase family protein n=1 Tax=Ferrovibrio sp. TaxID=1917215 RepID=UPI000CB3C403|nr:glutathione S-transferase family protein [Ferrovibrio sp.]PJI38762.1 MAG: glutathione S-transferase [Ferrovibrio sp.]
MLKFYFNGSPNPTKVALFLEETGLLYEPVPVDTKSGAQFSPEFMKLNPNAKVPVIEDDGTVVFDSNAILLYLAEKHDMFMPESRHRGQMLSWLMFVATGIGPYSGQSVHFRHFANDASAYAANRYQFEAERHFKVLDDHLAANEFLVGGSYSFVDMAAWGWARMLDYVMGDAAPAKFPHVKRFVHRIGARDAAKRALSLKESFSFKPTFDDEARRYMFQHQHRKD